MKKLLPTLIIIMSFSLISPVYAYDEDEIIYQAKQRGASQSEIQELEDLLYRQKYQQNYVPAYGDVPPAYDTAPYQRSLQTKPGGALW